MFGTRPIYTDFNGASWVFMQPYLGLPWTDSHHLGGGGGGAVDVFHHAPPIYGVQNAEMKKKLLFFCDVIASVLYNAKKSCLKAYDRQPCNRIKA